MKEMCWPVPQDRKRLSKDMIINEIESNKGFKFDPKIAGVMLGLLREGKLQIEA